MQTKKKFYKSGKYTSWDRPRYDIPVFKATSTNRVRLRKLYLLAVLCTDERTVTALKIGLYCALLCLTTRMSAFILSAMEGRVYMRSLL